LNAIVDVDAAERAGWRPLDLARAFLEGGARFLQLRGKGLPSAALLDTAAAVADEARAAGAIFIVNDRADVAALSGADGVHVGQEDLAPHAARRVVGPEAIVGLSTHTEKQIQEAAFEPATYIAIGPVFGTSTKVTGYAAVGLEMVRRARRIGKPVVAIGGITIENVRSVIEAGADAVAVIGGLLGAGSPEARVRAYIARLIERPAPRDRHV
jgi:thiamine-phosphate pyrophosphorylase